MSITLLAIYSRAGEKFPSGLELRSQSKIITLIQKSSASEHFFVTAVNLYEEILLIKEHNYKWVICLCSQEYFYKLMLIRIPWNILKNICLPLIMLFINDPFPDVPSGWYLHNNIWPCFIPPPQIINNAKNRICLINEEETLNPCILLWKFHETMAKRGNKPTVFK